MFKRIKWYFTLESTCGSWHKDGLVLKQTLNHEIGFLYSLYWINITPILIVTKPKVFQSTSNIVSCRHSSYKIKDAAVTHDVKMTYNVTETSPVGKMSNALFMKWSWIQILITITQSSTHVNGSISWLLPFMVSIPARPSVLHAMTVREPKLPVMERNTSDDFRPYFGPITNAMMAANTSTEMV